jgi:very-short-patch-repair endonuclease
MRLDGSLTVRSNAKRLRKQMTPHEIALWLALRGNEAGLRFRRQHAAGPYVLDFYCAPARLAIEVDGESHNHGNRPERDATRDAWLVAQNIRVLHYPAREMLANLDDLVRQVTSVAVERRTTFES